MPNVEVTSFLNYLSIKRCNNDVLPAPEFPNNIILNLAKYYYYFIKL